MDSGSPLSTIYTTHIVYILIYFMKHEAILSAKYTYIYSLDDSITQCKYVFCIVIFLSSKKLHIGLFTYLNV